MQATASESVPVSVYNKGKILISATDKCDDYLHFITGKRKISIHRASAEFVKLQDAFYRNPESHQRESEAELI